MPDELMQARKIASERKEILAGAQDSADKIIEKAHLRAKEIISEDEITRGAEAQAAEILANASLWASDLSDLTEIITEYYNKIDAIGAKETMKWILS